MRRFRTTPNKSVAMNALPSIAPLERDEVCNLTQDSRYLDFIAEIKQRVLSAQIKAAIRVNQELLYLYWDLGARIVLEQKKATWGDGFLLRMSQDLQAELPNTKGFSLRNLKYMRQWFSFWSPVGQQVVASTQKENSTHSSAFVQQLVAQIPWGHNLLILRKIKKREEALFYVQKTIENHWSRSVLEHQIDGELFLREGHSVSNFSRTLPASHSDLAHQMLKDPYCFDFLMLSERHNERELEDALMSHLTRFLLEMGTGFSFLGRQYRLDIDGDDYFVDMLFYHVQLHCYVVIELKTKKFKPEFVGKLNFYVSAVDCLLRKEADQPTIGILICKSKNNTVVEYSLKDVNKPIGVSEYKITTSLPQELRPVLPSIEELEAEVNKTISERRI